MYRSIGINRTGVTAICQIRSGVPDQLKGIEWVCFGSTTFSATLPVYTNVSKMPKYLSNVAMNASTENLYWASRMIGALADHSYAATSQHIERYQLGVMTKGRQIIGEYDKIMTESGDFTQTEQANEKLCAMAKELTDDTLTKVLAESSKSMKNGYNLADN
jgi:dipeptidase